MNSPEQFEKVSEVFSKLPMYFMDLYGSTKFSIVKTNIIDAIEKLQVQHVIIDNLQFMTGDEYGMDKYEIYDRIISEIRLIATTTNTHVTVVIHPRKEADNTPLSIASIQGTPKATQEADNIIILQKTEQHRYLEVKKNRFKGDLGRVPYSYDPESCSISEKDLDFDEQTNDPPIVRSIRDQA
jgi:twinkle protein